MHASITLVAIRFLVVQAQLPTTDGDVPSVEEICPYSRFCSKGPSKTLNINGARPCCLPCSCSDRCLMTGNCCPDKTLQEEPEKVTQYFCRDQRNIYGKLLNGTFSKNYLSYRIIDTCPWERSGNEDWHETASECYRAPTDIRDLMFVSDAETYDVFINKHCAECNGVTDIIYWHLEIKCPPHEFINLTSFHERDKLIRSGGCQLSSRPPLTDIGMHSVCFDWATNKCNDSRNWGVYDREIERRCNSYNSGYVYVRHAYANVYCYLCNIPSTYDMHEICPAIDFFEDDRGLIVKFTAIITQTDGNSKANSQAMDCKETEVMDPFLATCTDLICPVTYLPNEGACQALAEEYEGLFVEAHLDLGPAILTSSSSVRNLHYDNIIHGIKNMLKPVKAARCGICHVTVADQNNGERVAKVMFQPTKLCGTMKLTNVIETVFQKEPKEIKLPDGMVTSNAYLRKEKIDDDKTVYGSRPDKCGYSVFYKPGSLTCPSIIYQLPRLRETVISNQTINKIKQNSKPLSDLEFRICLGAYLRIFKEANAGSASLKGMFKGSLVAVIVSWLICR